MWHYEIFSGIVIRPWKVHNPLKSFNLLDKNQLIANCGRQNIVLCGEIGN